MWLTNKKNVFIKQQSPLDQRISQSLHTEASAQLAL